MDIIQVFTLCRQFFLRVEFSQGQSLSLEGSTPPWTYLSLPAEMLVFE